MYVNFRGTGGIAEFQMEEVPQAGDIFNDATTGLAWRVLSREFYGASSPSGLGSMNNGWVICNVTQWPPVAPATPAPAPAPATPQPIQVASGSMPPGGI